MDVNKIFFLKFSRWALSIIWLGAALLATPLAFPRIFTGSLPLWPLVNLVTMPVMTLISLGIILIFPERVIAFCRDCGNRLLLIAAGGFFAVNLWNFLAGKIIGDEFLSALFWLSVPLAAVALADEVRKILPFFASFCALLLIVSGIRSENFTGFTGNWNWTMGMIAALLPGFCSFDGIKRQWCFFAVFTVMYFLLLWWCIPVFFPRAALIAVIVASAVICLRRYVAQKYFKKIVAAGIATGAAGLFWLLLFFDLPDTRFQIWKGALSAFFESPLTGVGNGHFSEVIRSNLGEIFFYSPFPAVHIEHAHNDLLNILVESGIFGAFFLLTVLYFSLCRRQKDPCGTLAKWIFLVLIVCGCFDQPNITMTGGFMLALCGGVVLDRYPVRKTAGIIPAELRFAGVVAGIIMLIFAGQTAYSVWSATVKNKQADELMLNGEFSQAIALYDAGLQEKKNIHAAYQCAELNLISGNPLQTLHYIRILEDHLGKVNYRHTQRLKAVALMQTGEAAEAAKALEIEEKNMPFSVITADFKRFLLRKTASSPASVAAAERNFAELSRQRGFSVEKLRDPNIAIKDDGAFPEKSRKEFFAGKSAEKSGIPGEIAAALLTILAAYGIGRLICDRISAMDKLAALACGTLLLGMASLLLPGKAVGMLLLIPALPGGYFAMRDIRRNWKISLIVFLLFMPLLASMLLPPSGWDEQVYQLALLKRYCHSGSAAVCMDNPYSAYPSLGQLLVLPGFALGGMNVPVLILWLINGIMAARFLVLGKVYGKVAAALALLAIMLSPLTWNIIRNFYVESFIVLYGFAGILLLMKHDTGYRQLQIAFAGIMAGAAASVKLTGIGVSLALLILLLTDRENRRMWWIFCLGALAAALPFLLRVWISCGNPVYPYFSALFNGGESAVMVEAFHRTLGGNYGVSKVWGIFLNWILAAFDDGSTFDGIITGCQYIVAVALIFTALLRSKLHNRKLAGAFLALLGAWIFWNISAQQTRFLYPLIWAAAFLALYGSISLDLKLKQLFSLLLVLSTALTVYWQCPQLKHYFLAWKTLPEARKNPAYFAAWSADEEVYAEVVEQMREIKNYRLATLWDRRILYLPDGVTVLTPGFQEKLTPVPETAGELYAVLRDFDYLLIRPPSSDVDKAVEFIPGALQLNGMILELLRQGRLTLHRCTSDGRMSILRIVPET